LSSDKYFGIKISGKLLVDSNNVKLYIIILELWDYSQSKIQ